MTLSAFINRICKKRSEYNCWGCPFKTKAGRKSTCKEWIEENQEEAWQIAFQYVKNGYCLYDRFHKPYVGQLKDKSWQQICPKCQNVVNIKNNAKYWDDYVEEWRYECPICHNETRLRQDKRSIGDITDEILSGRIVCPT